MRLALARGIVPPTINLETPDPECRLDYVPTSARETSLQYAQSNSFGFGGTNVSLVLNDLNKGHPMTDKQRKSIAIASDHAGFEGKEALSLWLVESGWHVHDLDQMCGTL